MEKREHEIRPCVGMGYCIDSIYSSGEGHCIHNAATGREDSIPHVIPKSLGPRKKVVIVGAGPAGLEAARVAAERGHEVVVFEAAPNAGGQVHLTSALKRRREILGIIDWRLSECARLGVRFHYNRYAEVEDVMAEAPDYVVIATGGIPDTSFLESGAELATSSWDILSGAVRPAASVILYDDNGGHSGMTTAEFLAETGSVLELVTPERTLAPDVGGTSYPPYFKTLNQHNTVITINLRLRALKRTGNQITGVFLDEYGKRDIEKQADQIVVEHGTLPVDALYFDLKPQSVNLGEVDYAALIAGTPQTVMRNADGGYRLFRIGDAVASRNIHAAVYDAIRLMKDI